MSRRVSPEHAIRQYPHLIGSLRALQRAVARIEYTRPKRRRRLRLNTGQRFDSFIAGVLRAAGEHGDILEPGDV